MKISKIFTITLILILLGSAFYAQKVDEKTAVNAGISESVPYKPVELPGLKKKKEKKSKAKKTVDSPISPDDNSVLIPVSVLNKNGKFAGGLKPDDFKVFVDDTETEFSLVANNGEPLNVVMLFDVSPSTDTRIEQIQKIAAKIIDGLKPEDKVQLVKFSDKFQVLSELTTDRTIVDKAFKKLKMSGGTSLYDTIYKLSTEIIPAISGRKVLILFTDGVDTMSGKADFYGSLFAAEKLDVPVYPVYFNTFVEPKDQQKQLRSMGFNVGRANGNYGLGTSLSEYEIGRFYLNELVKFSGGRAIVADKLNLDKNADDTHIIEDVKSKYYLKIKPAISQETNQRRQIKIRINRPDLKLFSRGSYISNPN